MTRMGSGRVVDSTRITSAPRQPQINVAWAPNPSRVKSRIRTPSRAIGPAPRSGPCPLTRGDDSVFSDTRVRERRRSGMGGMRLEDLVLVSVDDHVVEPSDMFEGRIPARFAEAAPRVD